LFGPVLTLLLPTPLGDQALGLRLTPLTEGDARELLKPLEGRADLEAYKELVLRVSRLLEEFPQVERLELALSGPRVARYEVALGGDR
ncbi:MAG: GNAT family N-acetyltransferase, partial [Thermus sp.]